MPGPSLDSETVHVKVVYNTAYEQPAGSFNFVNATVWEGDLVVGAGVELSGQAISYTFTDIYGSHTISGTIGIDISGAGYTVTFNGTSQPSSLDFVFSSLNDQSIYSVTAATETAQNLGPIPYGQDAYVNLNTSTSVVTSTFFLAGYEPASTFSETVALTYGTAPAGNTAPVITSNGGGATAAISVAENSTAVTTVTATDAESNPITYSIVGGADSAKFSINSSTGALSFVSAPNFEAPTDSGFNNVYDVTVRASDGALVDDQAIAVTVTNVNEAPTITSNGGGATASVSVAENSTVVTTVAASDPDAATTITYSIVGGADAAKFSINSSTGALSFVSAPNFEAPTDSGFNNVYDVTVRASDGALVDDQAIAVTVTNVNEAPTITSNGGGATASVSVAENSTVVTTVAASDPDAATTITYSIVGGADAAKFSINSSTGALSFVSAPNFEAPTDSGFNNVYDVTVRASDGALVDDQAIAVTVTNVNEAPTITSNGGGATASVSVAENSTVVTTVAASDPDAATTITYSIVGGADAAKFSINSSTGALSFVSAPNFEAPTDSGFNNVYDVTVRASDGALVDDQAIAVTVTNVNEAPVNVIPGVQATNEDTALVFSTANGNAIQVSDVDVGGGTMTVTLNATHGTLTLSGTTGLVFATGDGSADATMTFDGTAAAINAALQGLTFNPAANYYGAADVTITTNDNGNTGAGGALQDADTVAITVTSVNDAPSGTDNTLTLLEDGSRTLTASDFGFSDIDGNSLAGVKITTLPGAGTLTLNGGAVSAGQVVTLAQLNANQLVFTPAANANGAGYASLTFQVQDDGGTANGGIDLDQSPNTLTFDVTAVNDAPVNGVPGGQTMLEDTTLVFSTANGNALSVSDVDVGGGTMTVTLAATHGTLSLSGTAGLTFAIGDGTSDASMTFDGTLASINAALQGLAYTPDANYFGPAGVTLTTSDQGNTGTGGALQDADMVAITVINVDDPAVARDDRFTTIDAVPVSGNLFADNGFGADYDIDGPALAIGKVDNQPGLVGMDYVLASGATVHVNADGTFTYTPGGAAAQLAAPGSGATNTQLAENFDYTLVGGGTGNVTIVVQGTDGYDTLLGTQNADSLHGGLYDDVLIGGLGADMLDGGTGNDTASYAGDPAGVFANLSTGQGYANSSFGDTYTSIENLVGTDFNDFLIGDPGVNVLDGGAGNDTIIGGLGPDVLIGGAGIDTLSYEDNSGTVFVNLLTGKGYNNAAQGDTYSGFENVIGGLFDDTIIGDNGANRLDGAMGADTLVGNGGADTFVFSYAPGATSPWGSANVDTIFDFVSGEDKLEINAAAFGGGLAPGALPSDQFLVGSAAGDANDRFIYDQASGNLYFDADGSGGGAQVLMAILPNHDVIAATDFVIV